MSDFFLALLTAVFTSIFTVSLALWRYRREQVWARKLDSYTRILDALHVVRLDAEWEEAHLRKHQTFAPDQPQSEKQLTPTAAYSDLRRIADIGGLIVSDEATALLAGFFQKNEEEWDDIPPDYYGGIARRAGELIRLMKVEAQRDLRLQQSWLDI